MSDERQTEPTKIYRFEVKKPVVEHKRISMLIWGKSGSGKTELAATAPGKILFINFDPDGYDTLQPYTDKVDVMDLATEKDSIVKDFKDETTPFMRGLISYIEDNPDTKTIVVDSLTSFGDKALAYGVKDAASTAQGKSSTLENPGMAGYGRKSTWTLAMVRTMLQVTGRLNRNIIFLAHEDAPDRNSDGVVIQISLLLGSSLSEKVPLQISEVWALTDNGKKRTIAVRPIRLRKPMKTRMFWAKEQQEFIWDYDARTQTGEGIETWYNAWLAAGTKIELPNKG